MTARSHDRGADDAGPAADRRDRHWETVSLVVPVVFLVLPVTVLFAFFPGVIGLSLTIP